MVSGPDTIAAVASGGVVAAIGIVRISGPETLSVMDRVFRPSDGRKMSDHPDRQLVYGELLDGEGQVLDLCLGTVSRGPRSYTGEDTAELQCHGSPVVLRAALESLFAAGARSGLLKGEIVFGGRHAGLPLAVVAHAVDKVLGMFDTHAEREALGLERQALVLEEFVDVACGVAGRDDDGLGLVGHFLRLFRRRVDDLYIENT